MARLADPVRPCLKITGEKGSELERLESRYKALASVWVKHMHMHMSTHTHTGRREKLLRYHGFVNVEYPGFPSIPKHILFILMHSKRPGNALLCIYSVILSNN